MEEGAFAGGFVEVKRLGVVLFAELLDLGGGDRVGADGIETLTDVEVLVVKLLGDWVVLLLVISLKEKANDREHAETERTRRKAFETHAGRMARR